MAPGVAHQKWNRTRGRRAGPPSSPPLKPGPKNSCQGQEAYTKIDSLPEGKGSTASPLPAPGEVLRPGCYTRLPTPRGAHRPALRPSRAGPRRGRGRLSRTPARLPTSTPAAAGPGWEPAVGARVPGPQGVRCWWWGCARGRVHERLRRPTLGPQACSAHRTGPLQLPRAMILWKQKLKLGEIMGDRLAVIWAKLGQADPQGGGGRGDGRPDIPLPSPSSPRAGPSGDSNQAHNTVSFLART